MRFISCVTPFTEANVAIVPKPAHQETLPTLAKQSSATVSLWTGHAFLSPARHSPQP